MWPSWWCAIREKMRALSLCVNPMPSRITRKSTRPRVADRTMVDTVQPRVLASFRNRSALSLLMNMQLLRWSKAKPETKGQDTRLERHSYLTRDWMPRTITRASGGGRRMFLTSPLIEQAIRDPLSLRFCFTQADTSEFGVCKQTI